MTVASRLDASRSGIIISRITRDSLGYVSSQLFIFDRVIMKTNDDQLFPLVPWSNGHCMIFLLEMFVRRSVRFAETWKSACRDLQICGLLIEKNASNYEFDFSKSSRETFCCSLIMDPLCVAVIWNRFLYGNNCAFMSVYFVNSLFWIWAWRS